MKRRTSNLKCPQESRANKQVKYALAEKYGNISEFSKKKPYWWLNTGVKEGKRNEETDKG